jgi:DNA polymerase III delta prime subunit
MPADIGEEILEMENKMKQHLTSHNITVPHPSDDKERQLRLESIVAAERRRGPEDAAHKRTVLPPEVLEALEILQAENELHRRIYTAATLTQSAMEAALEDLRERLLCSFPEETEDIIISQLAFEAKQKTSFMHRRLSAASQALTAKCAQARKLLSKYEVNWDLDQCRITIDKVIHEITSSAALKQQAEEAHQFIEDTRLLLKKCDDANALRLLTAMLRQENALGLRYPALQQDADSNTSSSTTNDQTIPAKGALLQPEIKETLINA